MKKLVLLLSIILVFSLVLGGCNISSCFSGEDFSGEDVTIEDAEEIFKAKEIQIRTVSDIPTDATISDVVQNIKHSVVDIEIVVVSDTQTQMGAGSGLLFGMSDTKYYVLTNHHVVDGANMIWVVLSDNTKCSASFIASDEQTDIALLTISRVGIDENKYKTVILPTDEYQTRVGDTAIVIGNPLGEFHGSVTMGIVSALDRKITFDGEIVMNAIQTDATINLGNSGGGMFDRYGQLIGVVNAKMIKEGVERIGFAIPVKTAVKTACDLLELGYVTGRPAMGITLLEIASADDMYEFYYNLSTEARREWESYMGYTSNATGLYVYSVTNPDCLLKVGDYVTAFNGQEVTSREQWNNYMNGYDVGDRVSLTVLREGESTVVDVTLIEVRE